MGKDRGESAQKSSGRQRKRKPASARFSRPPKAKKEARKEKRSRSRLDIQEEHQNGDGDELDELSLMHGNLVHDQRGKALPSLHHENGRAALTKDGVSSSDFLGLENSCGFDSVFSPGIKHVVDEAPRSPKGAEDDFKVELQSYGTLEPVFKNKKLEDGDLHDVSLSKLEAEHDNEKVRWQQAIYSPWKGIIKSEAKFENQNSHTAFCEMPEKGMEALLPLYEVQHIETMMVEKTLLKAEDHRQDSLAVAAEYSDFDISFESAREIFDQDIDARRLLDENLQLTIALEVAPLELQREIMQRRSRRENAM